MATITKSVNINRPPDEVFAYLDDLNKHPEWQPQIESRRIVTEGPTRVGTEVDDTRVVGGGRKVPMRWKVTEHDPAGRRSAFETIESKMIKPSGVISVAQAGEGSEVTFEFTTNPFGFGWLMAPLINRDVAKTVTENLGRLKENLERS
ncbi:MAG: hypothetical protein E6G07_09475 [Actinobacteria bacterium]|nr:MAG: hypothetical protein E6G53_03820 [Actinomycetota bacterium]TML78563.1 MAG: hypothetical protein E6G07_09475 [Actinomycetota bacterium]